MSDARKCPVESCSFSGSIEQIIRHIDETPGALHSWSKLGFEHPNAYRSEAYVDCAHRIEQRGTEALNADEFETAKNHLEEAVQYYGQAFDIIESPSAQLVTEHEQLRDKIDDVETARGEFQIDQLVDQAANHLDAGDSNQQDTNIETARLEYEQAADALREALQIARDVAPERIDSIKERQTEVQFRQARLEPSKTHKTIIDLVSMAQEHATAGDSAFKEDRFEDACSQYKAAIAKYEKISNHLEGFTFGDPTNDSNICDVCRGHFPEKLKQWDLNSETILRVCPSCSQFDPDGILPTPADVTTEIRYLKENIESIETGETGLQWTTTERSDADHVIEADDYELGDRREMVLELVGLVQSLGRVPTAVELDERTEVGFLGYKEQFGGIEEALVEAGFEVAD